MNKISSGEHNAVSKDVEDDNDVRVIGRYALHGELASGGMASVHLGRLLGEVGFARTVAIKRLHTQYARDPEFVAMFLDEARLVSRIVHPNVVPTLDIVSLDGELFLVMDYVHGEPLHRVMMALSRRKERMPVNVAVGICLGLLEGLHAAHEAKGEDGAPLGIVHRDISPQNVMIGADGVARVLDFGIAQAAQRIQTTEDGQFKGKLGYMPPDVLSGDRADRRADVWGAAVVLWEMLVGRRLFVNDDSPFALVKLIVEKEVDPPSRRGVASSPALDAVVMRGLMKAPGDRYATAREMAVALEAAMPPASGRAIGEWLHRISSEPLAKRAARVEAVELASRRNPLSIGAVRVLTGTGSGPSLPSAGVLSPAAWPVPSPHTVREGDITGPQLQSLSAPNSGVMVHEGTLVLSHDAAAAMLKSVPPPSASSMSSPSGFPPPSSARTTPSRGLGPIVLVAAGIGFVAALIVAVFAFTRLNKPTETSSTPTASATASSSSSPSPPPIEVASAAASESIPVVPPALAPSATTAQPQHPPRTTPRGVGGAQQPVTAPKPPKADCNPPYTIGPPPDYIRKPKLECLSR